MSIVVLLDAFAIFVHILSGLFISGKSLSGGKTDKREMAAAFCVTVLTVPFLVFIDERINRTFFVSCIEVIYIWVSSILFRKIDKRMGLFVSVIYGLAVHLFTLLMGVTFIIFFGSKDYIDIFTVHGALVNVIAGCIILAVSLVILLLNRFSSQFWLRIGMYLTIFSLIYINFIATFDVTGLGKNEIDFWIYYPETILGSIIVIQMRRQYETEKELAEMKADEAMILERQYRSLSNSYAANAKLFHDFRNHCGVLKNYLSKGKSEEALTYLEELTGPGNDLSIGFWTGDETVDYLIASKKSLAEEKYVRFDAEVEFPHNMNIKSSDLSAILGNLLDNAIEASSKISDPNDRSIRLIIRRIQQMLVIKVENTFEENPVIVDGSYKSSKKDGGLHGWGIKSASTAAEKYDGMVQSSVKDNVFTTVVTLSF